MRFASAIMTRFEIRYDPDHVGRIMHRLGLRTPRRNRRSSDMAFAARFQQEPVAGVA